MMAELIPDERKLGGEVLLRAEGNRLMFYCPGCECYHGPTLDRWTWNGSMSRPTFSPSILVQGVRAITDAEHSAIMAGVHVEPVPTVCHSFVRDGRIEFLGDCTHGLAGQTVEMQVED